MVKEAYNVGWRDFSGCSSLYYGKQMLRQVDAEASLRDRWCSQTPLFRNLLHDSAGLRALDETLISLLS